MASEKYIYFVNDVSVPADSRTLAAETRLAKGLTLQGRLNKEQSLINFLETRRLTDRA
jgi:hypothetical protein